MTRFEGRIFYIAGPITGIPEGNRPLFNEAHKWLEERGAVVLNPSVLPEGLPTHQSYMNICLPMLAEADAVVMLPGWRDSKGALMEYQQAIHSGMPRYEYSHFGINAMEGVNDGI